MSGADRIIDLRNLVNQIEASDDRIKSENGHKSDLYKSAKGKGFNVKALRKVIAARRQDSDERERNESDFDTYWIALEGVVRAHVETIEQFDPETGEITEPEPSNMQILHSAPEPATPTPSGVAADLDGGRAGAPVSVEPIPEPSGFTEPDPQRSDGPAREDGRADGSGASNVTQLRPKRQPTFADKPHADCLNPEQCGGFSNLGLCPRCKEAAGGFVQVEHRGSIG